MVKKIKNDMSFQLLISTMHQENYNILDKINVNSDCVVVNQCNTESIKNIKYKKNNILWIDTKDRGLSKSRNLVLKNATADICLLVDDDEVMLDGYEEKILNEFNKNPNADIIEFKIKGIERTFKKYYPKKRKLTFFTSMKACSVEIAFKRNKIIEQNIFFDELLGSGAMFNSGEENVFLGDCIKKGLKLFYVPMVIANLHIGNSTWFKGYNEDYFLSRGATFAGLSSKFYLILIIQFAIRHRKIYDKIDMLKAIKIMHNGAKKYLNLKKEMM